MAELKPCPFCGGKARIVSYDPFDGYQGHYIIYKVLCGKCEASINRIKEEEAIEVWNMRCDNG